MYNTGNPVPSSALEDMADNAQTFDALVTKTEGTTTDRLGRTRRVFQQIIMDMGFQPLSGSFQTGAIITDRSQTLYDEVSHVFYAWGGTLPKVVAPSSTPETTGGISAGAWVDRTDFTLRNDLAAINGNYLVTNSAFYIADVLSANVTNIPDGAIVVAASRNGKSEGGGIFNYSASSSLSADGGIVFAPSIGSGRLIRQGHTVLGFNGPVNVKWFGAAGDWNGSSGTNDTASFQSAINYVNSFGRGEVYAPSVLYGYYLNSQLWIKSGVTLKGAENQQRPDFYATTFNSYYGGHTLVIGWGSGKQGVVNSQACSAIRLSTQAVIQGFKFIYPVGQATSALASSMVPFPPAISAYEYDCNDIDVIDCWFVNAYRPIYFAFPHGPIHIKGCGGFPGMAAITLHGGMAGDVVDSPLFGSFWFLGNMPGAGYTNMSGIQAWAQINSIGMDIGYNDAFTVINSNFSNMYAAFRFGWCSGAGSSASLVQLPYGEISSGFSEGCTYPFYVGNGVANGISSNGVRVSGMGITCEPRFNASRGVCVKINQPTTDQSDISGNRCRLVFDNCEFWGSGDWVAHTGSLDGVVESNGGDVDFVGCTFKQFQLFIARILSGTPAIKFSSCQFNDYGNLTPNMYYFAAQPGAAGAILHNDCTFRKSPSVYYGSGATTFITNYSIPVLASAATLPIPQYGDSIFVTGTTNITNFDSTYAYNGRRVTLQFQSTPTVVSGGNLKLASSFAATGDDMLILEYRSSFWWEISRSVLP